MIPGVAVCTTSTDIQLKFKTPDSERRPAGTVYKYIRLNSSVLNCLLYKFEASLNHDVYNHPFWERLGSSSRGVAGLMSGQGGTGPGIPYRYLVS